jgi:hypothetical protein
MLRCQEYLTRSQTDRRSILNYYTNSKQTFCQSVILSNILSTVSYALGIVSLSICCWKHLHPSIMFADKGTYLQHFIFFIFYKWAQLARALYYTSPERLDSDKHLSLSDYMIMILHWLSIYTSTKHSLLQTFENKCLFFNL